MRVKYIILLLSMVFLYSCAEPPVPKYGEILFIDNETKVVSYKKVEITGLTSLSEMSGDDFKYLLNAKVSDNVSSRDAEGFDINTATIGDVNDLTYQDEGELVSLRHRISDDTIIPYSIEDSILLTLHYNLQGAIDFFKTNGLSTQNSVNGDDFGQIKIFFELNFETANESGILESMTDNAMYYPLLNSLAFLPQDEFKHLALVSNPMVITHEFAHAIFAYGVIGVMQKSDLYIDMIPNNCKDLRNDFYSSAMNEGFSDYWASRKTGSADLFYLSITKEEMQVHNYIEQDRTLENNRSLTTNMLVFSDNPDSCQNEIASKSYYWAGTIWASAMWEAEKESGIENFDKYLLKSYVCLNEEHHKFNTTISITTPGNCFVKILKQEADVTTASIDKVCTILKRRFSILEGELNECN